jgi:hypothetical protein
MQDPYKIVERWENSEILVVLYGLKFVKICEDLVLITKAIDVIKVKFRVTEEQVLQFRDFHTFLTSRINLRKGLKDLEKILRSEV